MRVLLLVLVIFLVIEICVANIPGRLLSQAFVVHPKKKVTNKDKKENKNYKLTKIKQLKSNKEQPILPTESTLENRTQLKSKEVTQINDTKHAGIIKKQASFNSAQQMLTSITTMILTRIIYKIDYKNARTVTLCRLTFCGYIILSQLLFWFLKHQIEKKDDHSPVSSSRSTDLSSILNTVAGRSAGTSNHPAGNLLSSMLSMTSGSSGSTTSTVKAYDLTEVQKLSYSLLFELLAATYTHLVSKNTAPLLVLPLMGLTSKLKAPIVQIHLFGMRAVGGLERPFKSGLEAMLAGFKPPLPQQQQQQGPVQQEELVPTLLPQQPPLQEQSLQESPVTTVEVEQSKQSNINTHQLKKKRKKSALKGLNSKKIHSTANTTTTTSSSTGSSKQEQADKEVIDLDTTDFTVTDTVPTVSSDITSSSDSASNNFNEENQEIDPEGLLLAVDRLGE